MKRIYNKLKRVFPDSIIFIVLLLAVSVNAKSQYLKRSLSAVSEIKNEMSTPTAHYKPFFGKGDNGSEIIKGLSRYGNLLIDPGGISNTVKYSDEEQVLFVMEGTGILHFGKENIPVSKNDFMYIPKEMKFGFSNPREQSISVIIMGFKFDRDTCISTKKGLMIANTDEVKFQTLPSHGPSTTFQLLLGTTESKRDRLAAACRVTSLFIMDFATRGTNIPHKHDKEEEIYLILKGHGDIVAGETDDGAELRHASKEGDAYFFSPKTRIGFYSGNNDEEGHARILAVRYMYPVLSGK
ncbi:MAG TPA: cupin domain-containing protein [Bacteroidales bacterium]|nr:cupin domain-containing protein [Bacteroidales bacterium]